MTKDLAEIDAEDITMMAEAVQDHIRKPPSLAPKLINTDKQQTFSTNFRDILYNHFKPRDNNCCFSIFDEEVVLNSQTYYDEIKNHDEVDMLKSF